VNYLAKELRNSFVITVDDVKYVCLSVYRDTDERHVIVTAMPAEHFLDGKFGIVVAFSFWATKEFEVGCSIPLDFSVRKVR
jgi:hypothetical protein